MFIDWDYYDTDTNTKTRVADTDLGRFSKYVGMELHHVIMNFDKNGLAEDYESRKILKIYRHDVITTTTVNDGKNKTVRTSTNTEFCIKFSNSRFPEKCNSVEQIKELLSEYGNVKFEINNENDDAEFYIHGFGFDKDNVRNTLLAKAKEEIKNKYDEAKRKADGIMRDATMLYNLVK